MKADPHLVQSEVPLLEGQKYVVLCGREVPRARFVLMFDALEIGVPLKLMSWRCCRKCLQAMTEQAGEPWRRERYIYGIISAGEELEESAA